jgi:predicted Rossmann-fold nucleotide-binding protein
MRILVTGGRTYADPEAVRVVLRELQPAVVIHGGAPGADRLADQWARANGVRVEPYPADWSRGPSAGPARNARMVAESRPDLVVAFPGGRGTADMVMRARAAGVEVVEVVGATARA